MSLFRREIEHDVHGRPEIVLYPNFSRQGTKAASYHIPLSDAWLYSEEHNPSFIDNMKVLCRRVGQFFGLYQPDDCIWTPETREEIAMICDIADTIQGGLDALVGAAPVEKDRGKQIGEATLILPGGQKKTSAIHEWDGLDPDDKAETRVSLWEGEAPDNHHIIVNAGEVVRKAHG